MGNTNGFLIINTDELQYYLKDLRKIPVIESSRQNELFLKLRNKKTSEKEKIEIRKEITKGNLRFVITIAKLYQNQGLDLNDLISEGNIGLIKAIDKYDVSSNIKFISYAVWWIRQSIMSSLNDYARTIRIPSNIVQEMEKKRKEDNLVDNYLTIKDFTLPYCVSLYDKINDEGDELIDVVEDKNNENTDFITLNNKNEIKNKLDLLLSVLDKRERIIIEGYFGLNGSESNLDDLGELLDCSKERVRQIKDKSIKKLRSNSFHLINVLC